jgi:hypothetical protein
VSIIRTRRGITAGIVIAVIAAAAAYAYWTSSGTGTGSASTATPTGVVNAVQTSTIANMYPGDTAQTLSGTFNNTNTGAAHVATVTVSIASVTKAVGAPAGTCDATDYTLANPVMTVDADVPAGNAQGTWTGATIKFNNKAANQDACKGATVNLSYAVA